MELVHYMLVGLSTALFWGSLLALTRTQRAQERVEDTARQLRTALGRVTALEGLHEALLAQHKKLNGRFYAHLQEHEQAVDQAEPAVNTPDGPAPPWTLTPDGPAPLCQNYHQAQIDGPRSAAAKCECGYCVEMRARREAVKRALVPKSNAARVEAIERGRSS